MIEFDPDMELEWWVGPDAEIEFEGAKMSDEREDEAKDLLEMAWEAIALRPQPNDTKAVLENKLLERIEVWLRGENLPADLPEPPEAA